jgi:serine/threonine protein kinase
LNWPAPSDYRDAIQNPRIVFSDPDLKNGKVTEDRFGLPKPVAGNFAAVFEVSNNSRKWAVRCFLREVHDQERRYDEIARHLQKVNLNSGVRFQFLSQGIRIDGTWFPIVKMEWVEGIRLDEYIRDNLNNPSALTSLTENWVSVTQNLQNCGVAHGDLQHGNIIIGKNGQIKIIDYDGMYVPSVISHKSYEYGHRNYQHPSRRNDTGVTATNYLNIDNFSSWVIGVSLALVCLDPTLWGRTQAGDDNLLFREIDFRQPSRTPTWQLLTAHANRRVREIARILIDICQVSSFLAVPPLDASFQEIKAVSRTNSGTSWIKDHVRPNNQSIPKSSWLLDHITDRKLPLKDFPDSFVLAERSKIQGEFQKLPLWERAKLRFQWQNYVRPYVIEHYKDYQFSKNRQRIEAQIKTQESERLAIVHRLATAKRQLADIEQKRKQQIEAKRELDSLNRELNSIPMQISSYEMQERQEIADYVVMRLRRHELRPGIIAGIGKARISHLSAVGIRTAADIVSANESRALDALRGIYNCIPEDDWRKLTTWRRTLENQISNPHHIRDKYQNLRWRLSQTQTEKKRRMDELTKLSWMSLDFYEQLIKSRNDVEQLEHKLEKLDENLEELTIALANYGRLTPLNLIAKVLKS